MATSTHESPWRYDRFVPVVVARGSLTAQRVYRAIEPVDITPTLAVIAGAEPPAGSHRGPLPELVRGFAA